MTRFHLYYFSYVHTEPFSENDFNGTWTFHYIPCLHFILVESDAFFMKWPMCLSEQQFI